MQIGFVGLQFSGKTTLFHTLTKSDRNDTSVKKDEAAIEVVKVPDERLDQLSQIFNPKKQVNATIEVFDFPGLRTGDDNKIKITSEFLNNVRNNDALFYIIREFDNPSVPHPLGSIDPLRDIKFLESEFIFSDLAFVENRIEKLKKDIMRIKDDKLKLELALIEKCHQILEAERPLRSSNFSDDEKKILSGFQLLTNKPLSVAINFGENSIGKIANVIDEIKKGFTYGITEPIPFFAETEYELSKMNPEDQEEFMKEFGIKESALSKILKTSYEILGLQSFFTFGEKECHAWTIRKNDNAHQAAGVIHSDFYERFIRAEVVHFEDFLKYKSMAKCKEAGAWRLEGKEYIVQDGDLLVIRHN